MHGGRGGSGGGWEAAQPWQPQQYAQFPAPQQQQQQYSQFPAQQQQYSQFPAQQQFNYLQNPNNLLYHHNISDVPFHQNPNFHPQNSNFQPQNPSVWQPPPSPSPSPQGPKQSQPRPEVKLDANVLRKCNKAVSRARRQILDFDENVSASKVSQAALLKLKVFSWESLGFQMQHLLNLRELMALEERINTFIHSFAGGGKLTSLYDLELAICKNEGVKFFEDLDLGPLVKHPLVIQYYIKEAFSIKEAFRITSEELISDVNECLNTHYGKEVKIGEALDYIAEKRSLVGWEKLLVRIQSVRELPKRDKYGRNLHAKKKTSRDKDSSGHPLVKESTKNFIATWKETCQQNSLEMVINILMGAMKASQRKKLMSWLFSCPVVRLLDVAVESIKCGMWDSMNDTLQTFRQDESDEQRDYVCVEDESNEKKAPDSVEKISKHECGVLIDDIIKNISSYFCHDDNFLDYTYPTKEKKFSFLRKLHSCESWLIEQLSVNDFNSLGYGDFFMFLERYLHLLPNGLKKYLTGEEHENQSFEVCMLQLQLNVILSQVSSSTCDNETISKKMVLDLLRKQFPSVCLKSAESDSFVHVRETLRANGGNTFSDSVLFSATLLIKPGTGGSDSQNEKVDFAGSQMGIDHNAGSLGSVTSKDAIEVLLRAPMLTDLDHSAHWDLIFAPSLGSLLVWLLNELNTKELLCLVTKGGKIVRLDHSATVESFLEALLEGSPFKTALKLLSLLAIYGGQKHVPLSLLKCHAQTAFKLFIGQSMEKEPCFHQDFSNHGVPIPGEDAFVEYNFTSLSDKLSQDSGVNQGSRVSSRFFLACLGYLPAEFHSFAVSVLLAGLQTVIKDAPSAILNECKIPEQRVMLHEVGFSLGILEWINDHHTFSSSTLAYSVISSKASCSKGVSFDSKGGAKVVASALKNVSPTGVSTGTPTKKDQKDDDKEGSFVKEITEVSTSHFPDDAALTLCKPNHINNPNEVIEAIRRDEFGLDSSLSHAENKLLMKQHTRLGRALHCLSQELYSQDSHFLLELVQNADDNCYPLNSEPSLTFILQENVIIVLNNEIGFSEENIRALCDVGSSTKRDPNAGYIGKKGIGFKSVFRVTDAPEIHSNGFHIKFDLAEGHIGFVLPTVVPPCDINLYSRLVSMDSDKLDSNGWKTCIVLPVKEKLCKGFAMNNIVSMFADLHPYLLLFLHRLQCIKLRNMLDNTMIVMRKEVADGIVSVSFGKEKMVWLVVSQKLQVNAIYPDVKETEISLAFTLEETGDGGYVPLLNQQPVFAFLPLRTYGLKFILQGDFVLPSSREEVDGNSPWNQWILSEFPELFVNAQKSLSDLPCFRENPEKAVTAFMSFVPLVGEVHGFFSSLPRMIISKLLMSKCLLLEADNIQWVLPCKVLRSWDGRARALLPDRLLFEHLGLGFLKKDIFLPDPLARALGIEEYGPKTLLHVLSSLSCSENGLKGMGLGWLSNWINEFFLMSRGSGNESDLIVNLKKIPFIPLSDGKYCSVDRGTIWLYCTEKRVQSEYNLETFSKLCAKLRTVNPDLLSTARVADDAGLGVSISDNVTRMLTKVGVHQLSAHEIVKVHILPVISSDMDTHENKDLLVEYLSFLMFHLQSNCPNCCMERGWIIDHLRSRALIFTNYGYKQLSKEQIHFNKEFGNPIDISRLIDETDILWHEIDSIYLRHPITKLVPNGVLKWRNFFQEIGITDFVKVVQVEKYIGDISIANDWESVELGMLLSQFSSGGDHNRCKYLLEILDTLWDECFSDKVNGYCIADSCEVGKPFESSFVTTLRNVKWMASTTDGELHHPKDLFHDCEQVQSILGVTAPYATPKVRSQKLLGVLGMKCLVKLDDVLSILQVWRRTETPFKASISQMSKFYTFIWNEMATSRPKILEVFSGAFIFVPHISGICPDDILTGTFLSTKQVCWYDTTGSIDQMKLLDTTHLYPMRMLQSLYPTLHDFFVGECGVEELPGVDAYLQILMQLSKLALPSQVAQTVFNVFSKWADQLKRGLLNDETIEILTERFKEKECAVLPTEQDKWVSLHPSFGFVCWSDDDKLRREFKNLDGVGLLYFVYSLDEKKQSVNTNVATLMRRLGIPALSSVITRQAIHYGPTDSSFKASVVNWALPYAQRYIFHVHPDRYLKLNQSGLDNLRCIRIVVVKKLFYKNVIKACGVASRKQSCSSLLEGTILYATQTSDSHSIFMELSRAFFDGVPELHLANFLHMIKTMVEAGSSEEQTEFFILNSQKVSKLPDGESIWSLSLPVIKNDKSEINNSVIPITGESNTLRKTKRMPGIRSNRAPVEWKRKTAPASTLVSNPQACDGFQVINAEESTIQKSANWKNASDHDVARAYGFVTEAYDSIQITEAEVSKQSNVSMNHLPPVNVHSNWTFQGAQVSAYETDHANDMVASCLNRARDSSDGPNLTLPDSIFGGATGEQAILTGRMGEFVAYKYFQGKAGEAAVKWVNEASETGLPYDILLGNEGQIEYIEVKATKSRSATRDLAFISTREWQFGWERGESFSIAHVILLEDNTARVTVYKNPVKLCQLGKLRLAIILPKT